MDKIITWGLVAGMAALWVWNWSLLRVVQRLDRQIREIRRWLTYESWKEE